MRPVDHCSVSIFYVVDSVVMRNGSWFALNLIKFLLSLRSRMQDMLGRATDNENY